MQVVNLVYMRWNLHVAVSQWVCINPEPYRFETELINGYDHYMNNIFVQIGF